MGDAHQKDAINDRGADERLQRSGRGEPELKPMAAQYEQQP